LAILSGYSLSHYTPSHPVLSSRQQDPADDLLTRIADAREKEHQAEAAWLHARAAGRPLAEMCRLRQKLLNIQALRYVLERRVAEREAA